MEDQFLMHFFARNKFQEIVHMMRFDNGGKRRQNSSPDKLEEYKKAF